MERYGELVNLPLPAHKKTVAAPDNNHTWLLLSCNSQPMAWFALDDTLRAEACLGYRELKARNLEVELLSGDNQGIVERTGHELGISACIAQATPDGKLERVKGLQQQGAKVLMVGDGINDIPVLAGADISVAMNTASDLACTHADALLMAGDLNRLLDAFDKAAQTRTIIRENTTWAIGYNLLALPLAASGWLAPWMAALGMSASSLVVVGNALRLSRSKTGSKQELTTTSKGVISDNTSDAASLSK